MGVGFLMYPQRINSTNKRIEGVQYPQITVQYNRRRTPELACTANLNLCRDLNRTSIRTGRKIAQLYTIQSRHKGGRGAGTGGGGWRHLWGGSGCWCGQAVSALRATGSHNLSSGARALRKYACDARTKCLNGKLCMRAKGSGGLRRFRTEY
eukprot:5726669-Pleurochrysis_carterae.AAC.1